MKKHKPSKAQLIYNRHGPVYGKIRIKQMIYFYDSRNHKNTVWHDIYKEFKNITLQIKK
jgi:hypothetical protein